MTKAELLNRFKILLAHFGIPYEKADELRARYDALAAQSDWAVLIPAFLNKLEARLRSSAPVLLDPIEVDYVVTLATPAN